MTKTLEVLTAEAVKCKQALINGELELTEENILHWLGIEGETFECETEVELDDALELFIELMLNKGREGD